MYELFLRVLDRSVFAGVAVLLVLFCRLLLKKAPKLCSYLLWSVVLLRLLFPFTLESPVSLMPKQLTNVSGELSPEGVEAVSAGQVLGTTYEAVGDALNGGLEILQIPVEPEEFGGRELVQLYHPEVWFLFFGTYVWPIGMAVLLGRSLWKLAGLLKKLRPAVRLRDNIYLADDISTPFVLGVLRPKIYLPSTLSEEEMEPVLLHEKHHIHRGDTIVKLLMFLALCLHWFNPLVWVAFFAASKDMEMSCDEAVVLKLGMEKKAEYSRALVQSATGHSGGIGTPLAFGEGDTKGRIKNLLKFKKPNRFAVLTMMLLVLCLVVLFLLNPTTVQREVMGADYVIKDTVYAQVRPVLDGAYNYREFSVTADYHLYAREYEDVTWTYLGKLENYDRLTKEELEGYLPDRDRWQRGTYRRNRITDAYRLQTGDAASHFYLVFQTNKGETFIGYGFEDLSERYDAYSDDTCLYWLYELESGFSGASSNGNFYERSIETALGFAPGTGSISGFHTYFSDEFKGYCFVAFRSGESRGLYSWQKPDWGFAVFELLGTQKDRAGSRITGEGFRLLGCHLYENVLDAENNMYMCSHPAVMDADNTITNDNSYDVLFFFPKEPGSEAELAQIVKTAWYGEEKKTITYNVHPTDYLVLLPWKDTAGADMVETRFYDGNGQEIEGT